MIFDDIFYLGPKKYLEIKVTTFKVLSSVYTSTDWILKNQLIDQSQVYMFSPLQ